MFWIIYIVLWIVIVILTLLILYSIHILRQPVLTECNQKSLLSSEVKQRNHSIYIFYHIYCNENTSRIVTDQIHKIIYSGLYASVDQIYCFFAGQKQYVDYCVALVQNKGKKFNIAKIGYDDTSYERFTLLQIDQYIVPGDKFLYLHSKGVKYSSEKEPEKLEPVEDWRNLMEFFLIYKYPLCLEKLDEFDIVGINYNDIHFSGNFWWSTANYYLKLPKTISKKYTGPEDYIFKGHPHFLNLYKSPLTSMFLARHYSQRFPMKQYMDSYF